MAYIYTWDETKPAGSRALNLGDDDIREFKSAIRERLQGGGMYFPATDDANAGLFDYVKFIEQSANPTAEANRGFLFTKDVSGVTELYWMDSAGNVLQLTAAGKISISNLSIASQTRGDILRMGASAWERYAIGASGTYLRSNGTDPVWAKIQDGDIDYSNLPNGAILQRVVVSSGAVTTASGTTPDDDTVPTTSEMGAITGYNLAITPKESGNKIVIRAKFNLAKTTNQGYVALVGMTIDAGTDMVAIGSTAGLNNTIYGDFAEINYEYTTTGTSEVTFKFHIGNPMGDTITVNGYNTARKFGGIFNSFVEAMEVKA